MRTTLDIDADVLQAAKEISRRGHSSVGAVLSELARTALTGGPGDAGNAGGLSVRNGVPVFPARQGEVITLAHVQSLEADEL